MLARQGCQGLLVWRHLGLGLGLGRRLEAPREVVMEAVVQEA